MYLPYMQRTVSMIYFDAREVFASLLSCPTLNQDANYYFDDAKDPFVAPQASSDVGHIHTGRGYRKTNEALIKKFGINMLLPCVIAMDKTHIDMAGRLQMEPKTISHGLLNHTMRSLPSAMCILGYINHSTPAHLPSSADVDSEFNSPVELVAFHTDRRPTTQKFTDQPALPRSSLLCASELTPERTPFFRYDSH